MKRLVFITFSFLSYAAVAQYTIPWATQQPAWVFPVYFEEGTGLKDTIYLGYDPVASLTMGVDTIFGEDFQIVNISEFKAYFSSCCDAIPDTVRRANVSGEGYGPGYSIFFNNGVLPLKISWDVTLFYHSALPFPDQTPAPRAQGSMTFGSSMSTGPDSLYCSWSWPILVTDTYNVNINCVREGTVLFIQEDSLSGYPVGATSFWVDKWIGKLNLNVRDLSIGVSLKIHPNPTEGKFEVWSLEFEVGVVQVFDLVGREVQGIRRKASAGAIEIDLSPYPAGIYFVKVGEFCQKVVLSKKP